MIEDKYLTELQESAKFITVFLANGLELKGVVRQFDEDTVLLEVKGRSHLVYKHAVATICSVNNRE